jgi:hypothetical protein
MTGVVLTLIAIAAILAGTDIKPTHDGGLGPRMVPMGAAAALLLLGLGQVAISLAAQRKQQPVAGSPVPILRIVGLAVLSIAYYFALGKVGYLAATIIATPLAFLLFGTRRPLTLVLVTVLCPAFFYLAFFVGLAVYPPSTDWFDLADLLRQF